MAKLIDLFTFSGRVGDVVACKGPTGYYLRSRPRKSSKPPTAKQLEARAKLAMAMDFLTPLREIVYLGFSNKTNERNKTGSLNRAVSHLTRYAIVGQYPDIAINPAEVRLSQGGLSRLLGATISSYTDGQLRVSWNTGAPQSLAFGDDRVFVLAYQESTKHLLVGESHRHTGSASVDISAEPTGSEWLVYAFVAERNLARFSDSQFLGKIRIEDE